MSFQNSIAMTEHKVKINWKRELDDFAYSKYDRTHDWAFEGGTVIKASAAEKFLGNPKYINPEEALAAALSSCHMLTFLAIASRKRITVDSYQDEAIAILDKNENGKLSVTKVILKPKIVFSGNTIPNQDQIMQMHHQSHHECFIANSVLTHIEIDPIF